MKLANYRARRFVVVMGMCGVRTDSMCSSNMCPRKLILMNIYRAKLWYVRVIWKKFSMLYVIEFYVLYRGYITFLSIFFNYW